MAPLSREGVAGSKLFHPQPLGTCPGGAGKGLGMQGSAQVGDLQGWGSARGNQHSPGLN